MSVSRFSMTTAEDAEERRFQLSTFPRAVTRLKCFRKIAVLESRMSLTRLPRWTAQPRAADHLDERAGHHRHKSGPASNRFRSQFLPADPVSSICRSVKIPPTGCTIRPEIFFAPARAITRDAALEKVLRAVGVVVAELAWETPAAGWPSAKTGRAPAPSRRGQRRFGLDERGERARLACGFGRRARTIGGTIQFGKRVSGATRKTATGTVALPSKNPAAAAKGSLG